MQAIVFSKYGFPDVLQLKEAGKPTPKDDEVLVKTHTASVNFSDWIFGRGKPFVVSLMTRGALKPQKPILGADIAGVVGNCLKQLQSGEEIFGDALGSGWCGF